MDVETQLALHGDRSADDQDPYVPYVSLDPLNDPKSFTFRIKVCVCVEFISRLNHYSLNKKYVMVNTNKECCKLRMGRERCSMIKEL